MCWSAASVVDQHFPLRAYDTLALVVGKKRGYQASQGRNVLEPVQIRNDPGDRA